MFVALVTQQAKRMRYIVICGLSDCTVFFHILINCTNFGGWELLNTKNVLNFYTNLTEIFLILRKIRRYIIANVHGPSRKVPVILVRFL